MPTDSVRIRCPNLVCRKVLAVPESARGKTVRCRNCRISIRVPAAKGGSDAAGKGSADKTAA